MGRRKFIGTLALGTLAVPWPVAAQSERKVHRIGVLSHIATASDLVGPEPRHPSVSALVHGLRELGHVYGEHFVIEPRGAEGKPERLPDLAAELVRLKVDVIVAPGPALAVLKQATSTIPVVMTGAGDPVAQGYVQSLGRPGGNFTGLSTQTQELVGKRLELLKELVPGAAPVAVLWDPRAGHLSWQAAESAGRKRGWKLLSLEIRDASEIEGALKKATAARAGALLVFTGVVQDRHAPRIAELAARSQPTKFDLVINLKAARSIGLAIPPHLLSRADEVIQ